MFGKYLRLAAAAGGALLALAGEAASATEFKPYGRLARQRQKGAAGGGG